MTMKTTNTSLGGWVASVSVTDRPNFNDHSFSTLMSEIHFLKLQKIWNIARYPHQIASTTVELFCPQWSSVANISTTKDPSTNCRNTLKTHEMCIKSSPKYYALSVVMQTLAPPTVFYCLFIWSKSNQFW